MKLLRARSLRAVAGSIGTGLTTQLLLLVSGLIAARLLGVEGRGYLAGLTAWAVVVSSLGVLGVPTAVTYYLSRDPARGPTVLREALAIGRWQALGLTGLLGAVLLVWTSGAPSEVALAAIPLVVAVPAMVFIRYASATLQGTRAFGRLNALRVAHPFLYAGALAAFWVGGIDSLLAIVVAWASVQVGTAVVALLLLVTTARSASPAHGDPALRGEMRRFGWRSFLGAMSPVDTLPIDQALVAILLGPAAAGLYAVAYAFTNLTRLIASYAGLVAFPLIAAQPDARASRRLMWRFFWGTSALNAVVTGALVVALPLLLPFFFGAEFEEAVLVAQVLTVGTLFTAARRLLTEGMRGRGHAFASSVPEISMYPVLLVGIPLLGREFGVTGVSVAMAVAYLVSLVVALALSVERSEAALRQGWDAAGQTGGRMTDAFRSPALRGLLALIVVAPLIGVATPALGQAIGYERAIAVGLLLIAGSAIVVTGRRLYSAGTGPWNPAYILLAYLAITYVARPAYILVTGDAGTRVLGTFALGDVEHEFITTLLVTTGSTVLFCLGLIVVPAGHFSSLARGRGLRTNAGRPLFVLFVLSSAAAVLVVGDVLAFEGGWQRGLVSRHQLFEGRGSLLWLMQIYKLAFLIWLAGRLIREPRTSVSFWLVLALWLPTVIPDVVSGSRAELLLRNLVPTGAILVLGTSLRTKQRVLVPAFVIVGLVLFVGYRSFVRDAYVAVDESGSDIFIQHVQELPAFLLGPDSAEATGFDHLLLTRMAVPEQLPHRGMETLEALIRAPLPGPLGGDAPPRASVPLAAEISPEHYARGGNPAFSGASDLYFTGGNALLLVGFAALGLLGGLLVKPSNGPVDLIELAFAFTAAVAFLSILRSDLFALPILLVRVGLFAGTLELLTRRLGEPAAKVARAIRLRGAVQHA